MMNLISAWAALAMAAMFAVNAYFQFATGTPGWLYIATALGLAVGGFRTLRKLSGGLRLLCGAWGFAAGLLIAPLGTALANGQTSSLLEVGLVLIALAGLAMTVLHKEKK